MLESLLLVTVLRLERNCIHHIFINLRDRRLNCSRIVENTNCINATVFNYVYYIVFVHMYAFYLYLLFIVLSDSYLALRPFTMGPRDTTKAWRLIGRR